MVLQRGLFSNLPGRYTQQQEQREDTATKHQEDDMAMTLDERATADRPVCGMAHGTPTQR